MKHVVMFSGGITSWGVARRVVDEHGPHDVTLLFADTAIEHRDLYRFVLASSQRFGLRLTMPGYLDSFYPPGDGRGELVWLRDGRTPFDVFRLARWIGNDRAAPCSRELKQKPCRAWIDEHCDPADTTIYVGIDWTELHRLPAIRRGYEPWRVEAPLTEPPYIDKRGLLDECRTWGVDPCVQYKRGDAHANCAGACVRAGHAAWAHLLRVDPDLYAAWEHDEFRLRMELGQGSILADRRGLDGGARRPLPLYELRARIEGEQDAQEALFDVDDWGGCGCLPNAEDAS